MRRARIVAFREGDVSGTSYVYWAGNATSAYPPEIGLERFVRHGLVVDDAYVVLFDDLRMQDTATASFQWLWHVVPGEQVPLQFDKDDFTISYQLDDVDVVLRHLGDTSDMTMLDLLGRRGQVNIFKCGIDPPPGTCEEDYRAEPPVDAHHLWITNQIPLNAKNFLSVVVPMRPEDDRPTIEAWGGSDKAVRVDFRGTQFSISFDPAVTADIVVDTAEIAALRVRGCSSP